jgi:hypothetical protein
VDFGRGVDAESPEESGGDVAGGDAVPVGISADPVAGSADLAGAVAAFRSLE